MNIRLLLVIGLCALTSLSRCAYAKSGETAINYSFVDYNPAKSLAGSRALNGGGGSVGFNLGDNFAIKGEIEGYTTTTFSFHLPPSGFSPGGTFQSTGSLVSYLFGPQFNLPLTKKRIFGEALFGGANTGAYGNLFHAAGITGLAAHNTGFAMAFGGGIDFKLSEHIGLRAAQVDYFMTRYDWKQIGINNQSNFRYQAGIVFAWGGGE